MESVLAEQIAEPTHATEPVVAVIVPCYGVRDHIRAVLDGIGPEVSRIYCVEDACPESSGEIIEQAAAKDERIVLLRHQENKGVGGAVVTGYRRAIEDGAEVVVKLDGDGQMDAGKIRLLIEPIAAGEADYVKGNRFFRIEGLRSMPALRIVGNAGLSFLTKLSTGYWNLFDPTNGFTAIHANVVRALPLSKLSERYFFESDILFRLNIVRAVIVDVPMDARYGDEKSNLRPLNVMGGFAWGHVRNFGKRLFYNYFLRNFNMASLHLVLGVILLLFGTCFGVAQWMHSFATQEAASSGTVMLAALPVILGVLFLLNFISFDMSNIPRDPIHRRIRAEDF